MISYADESLLVSLCYWALVLLGIGATWHWCYLALVKPNEVWSVPHEDICPPLHSSSPFSEHFNNLTATAREGIGVKVQTGETQHPLSESSGQLPTHAQFSAALCFLTSPRY